MLLLFCVSLKAVTLTVFLFFLKTFAHTPSQEEEGFRDQLKKLILIIITSMEKELEEVAGEA